MKKIFIIVFIAPNIQCEIWQCPDGSQFQTETEADERCLNQSVPIVIQPKPKANTEKDTAPLIPEITGSIRH